MRCVVGLLALGLAVLLHAQDEPNSAVATGAAMASSTTASTDRNPGFAKAPALPALVSVTPATIRSYLPPKLLLTGTGLKRTSRVVIGGQQILDFTPLSQTQLEVQLPNPCRIGTHTLTVHNAAGASNALSLKVNGMHPPVLTGEAFGVRGLPTSYRSYGDKAWQSVVFASTSILPSSIPGLLQLGIGNNFTDLWQVAALLSDDRGYAEVLRVPSLLPPFSLLYFQAVNLDPAAPKPVLEASNVVPTFFF